MKSKPNIDAFLDGGAASEKAPPAVEPSREISRSTTTAGEAANEFRKQMVMQLPIALINDLKRRALDESVRSGKRVTQQQLVEEALKNYLHK